MRALVLVFVLVTMPGCFFTRLNAEKLSEADHCFTTTTETPRPTTLERVELRVPEYGLPLVALRYRAEEGPGINYAIGSVSATESASFGGSNVPFAVVDGEGLPRRPVDAEGNLGDPRPLGADEWLVIVTRTESGAPAVGIFPPRATTSLFHHDWVGDGIFRHERHALPKASAIVRFGMLLPFTLVADVVTAPLALAAWRMLGGTL